MYIDARGLKMLLPTIKGSAFLSLFGGVAKAEVIIDIVMPNRLNIYARIDLWVLGAEVNITSELSLSGWPKMSVGAYVEFNGMDAAQKFATKVISEISGFAKKSSQDLANAGKDVQVKKREAQAALAKVCDREACITKVREWGCANWAKKVGKERESAEKIPSGWLKRIPTCYRSDAPIRRSATGLKLDATLVCMSFQVARAHN